MNAVTAVSTQEAARTNLALLEIPLDRISESKTNPRTYFDDKVLGELADDIRRRGVIEPVLVRPLKNGKEGTYELVFGARRYRASKLAKRTTIPSTVRELNDAEALELQLIENVQRVDLHPLDEAQGYAALLQVQPGTATVESIAAKVGRSHGYVNSRLQLLKLVPEAKEAFRGSQLTVSHAFELARLQPKDQQLAMRVCFPGHANTNAVLKDKKAEPITLRELRAWIENEIHLDLTNAPFDIGDAVLLPVAGSCAKCPKRTGNNPVLFPEVGLKKSTCTDRECFRAKVNALVQIRVKPLESAGEKVVRVSQTFPYQSTRTAPDVLHAGQYREVKPKECAATKPAVMIDGKKAGTTFYLCQDNQCPVHVQVSRYQPTPEEKAKRSKELLDERVEKQTRFRILDAIRKKLPNAITRPDLEMVALDYFRRLGHDNQRRLCKVYAWKEIKTKTSWGSESVDYAKIGATAAQAMTTADLHRFLVVCALASDLYCPSYNLKESLSKESNLARTATRYKVDVAKVSATVRAELTKTKESKAANNAVEKLATSKYRKPANRKRSH